MPDTAILLIWFLEELQYDSYFITILKLDGHSVMLRKPQFAGKFIFISRAGGQTAIRVSPQGDQHCTNHLNYISQRVASMPEI